MFLIVGLGNPGRKYEKTRHNAGFMAVDFLLTKNSHLNSHLNNCFKENKKLRSLITEIKINSEHPKQKIILAKPQTFMNNSGQAVHLLVNYYKIKPENIIIVYDEIDLPLGAIRIRKRGSSAGHRGIESIIKNLGTDKFWRVRIGISNNNRGKMPAEHFVLKKFSREELKKIKEKILPETIKEIKKIVKEV